MDGKCPVIHGATNMGIRANADWWPNQLNLKILHQNSASSNPLGADFDYAKEFASLDLDAVKADIRKALTTSQPWWPGPCSGPAHAIWRGTTLPRWTSTPRSTGPPSRWS